MNLQSYAFCWNCPGQCLKHILESSLYAMLRSFSSASAMEQNSVSSNPIEEHRVATDGFAYIKQEFLDYYGAKVGENLWRASEVDRLIVINAKYRWVSQLQWLNLEATPRTLRSVIFYYWARWTMIAMRMGIILNACNDSQCLQ